MSEIEILHSVVEHQYLRFQFANRETPSLDAVLVHDHGNPIEVLRQHKGLISGELGIQHDRGTGRNDLRHPPGGNLLPVCTHPLLGSLEFPALVSPRKDCDLPAAIPQGSGEKLDDRCFPGSAEGDVADRNNLHTEEFLGLPAAAVTPNPALHEDAEKPREAEHEHPRQRRTETLSTTENHIGPPLLQLVDPLFHLFGEAGRFPRSGQAPRVSRLHQKRKPLRDFLR